MTLTYCDELSEVDMTQALLDVRVMIKVGLPTVLEVSKAAVLVESKLT